MSPRRESDDLRDVLAARQRNVLVRVLMPLVIAGGFTLLVGDAVRALWAWAALYAILQAGEFAFNRRLLAEPGPALGRGARAMVIVNLVAGSLVFILGAALLLATRLVLAPSLSVLIAAGALLNSIVMSRRSLAAFLALNLPHFAWLFAMPILMAARMPGMTLAPAFGMGAVLLCVCATLAWLSLSRALRAAVRARAEAEAARDARATFTATISHELRTPLTAVLAAASALEMQALDPQNREQAALICDASRLMRRLLDDLLDFSKLEAGRMAVEVGDFDLRALAVDTLRLWSPEAAARGVALTVHGLDDVPRIVRGDAMRLRQVLNNLFSNAVKFTVGGEVRLELAAMREATGWRVRLAVADTGSGLDEAALQRLFTPFEQASVAVARTHGGTGLGLAISRELARLMNGDLVAERRGDAQGARFTLDLLLGQAAAPIPAVREPDGREGAAVRVLVIDDHPLGRQALMVLLGVRGFDARASGEPAEALQMLQTSAFDLVLCDLNLGGLDGREVTRRLRSRAGPNRRTPVLAVTGDSAGAALASCLAAGMDGLVAKPVEPRALYAAVDAALAAGRPGSRATDSREDSAASSFSSHSHTVSTVQPAASNAA